MEFNPHSYGCTRWTFNGNQMFPLIPVDLKAMRGSWRPLTFVDPVFGNNGPEFAMLVNSQRMTIPMGVLDKFTNRNVGDLVIGRDGAKQTLWRGMTLESNAGSLRVLDTWTFQFTFNEAPYSHSFTCRDFNRGGAHHLLCSWDILMPRSTQWQHKGFFGYLRDSEG